MKELIAVQLTNIGNEEVNAISARDLHKHLESKQDFSTWIKARIEKYEFAEGVDFTSFHKIVEREIGATKQIEYIISLDMAKELSMVENNAKGKEARKYFIECEKAAEKPMSHLEILAQSALALVAVEKRQLALEQEIKTLSAKVTTTPTDYYTIAGYAALQGLNVNVYEARDLGKKAAQISRELDYPIHKTHSEIFGVVNTYHVAILTRIIT